MNASAIAMRQGHLVVAAAVMLGDGRVFVGKRHNDCFQAVATVYQRIGMEWDDARLMHIGCVQGFITDHLEFLSREEALEVAIAAGQCLPKEAPPAFCQGSEGMHSAILMSEDLW